MELKDIMVGQTYRGGKNNTLRTIVRWGYSRDHLCFGLTRKRLPLGGFVNTQCISTKAFAKWATDFAHSGWTVETHAADLLDKEGEFVELDMGGWRYTRYGKGITIQESTCLRQQWMCEEQWLDKLEEFLRKQPPEMGIYTDRFKSGDAHRLLQTVGVKLKTMREFA